MATTPIRPIEFEPFEDATDIPYDLMSDLRKECPVFKTSVGMYYLARHEDVEHGFRQWRTFANAGGMRLPGVVVPEEEQTINEMDGPRHQRLRRLMQWALQPAKVQLLEPFIAELAERLIRKAVDAGSADLVADLTQPIPNAVIARVIGIPEPEHMQFCRWSDEIVNSTWPTLNRTERGEGLAASFPEFVGFINEMIDERRTSANPPDDFITRVLGANVEGEGLTNTEMQIAIVHIIYAGDETTTNLVGNLLYELIRQPDLYREVQGNRSLVPIAIEESLRHDSPVQMLTRMCARSIDVAGTSLQEGDRIVLGMASANRDENVFDHPDEFRLDRAQNEHIAFGKGAHLCLGADLARLEALVTVNKFLDLAEHPRLADDYVYEKIPVFWVCGPSRLDVIFE